MAATKLVNQGQEIVLANPDTGATLTVPPGGEVDAADWPGLADRPDFAPAPTGKRKKSAPTGGEGGSG